MAAENFNTERDDAIFITPIVILQTLITEPLAGTEFCAVPGSIWHGNFI
jgi:hypothetical protein